MNQIIMLWSHPRSVSSAMERIMLERGDLTVFHEPFIYLYYVGDGKKTLAYFDVRSDHPTSYVGIRNMILEGARHNRVFAKDMSYYISDYIEGDPAFIKRVTNTFLIRHPKKSIPSYYKLDPEVRSEEIGLEAQWRHFELVREITGETPIVIDADDLQRHTEATMRVYSGALDLPFLPESLSWEEDIPESWQHVAGWHGDLAGTKGIGTKSKQKVDVDSSPTLRAYYDHHLPFYQKLRKFKRTVEGSWDVKGGWAGNN